MLRTHAQSLRGVADTIFVARKTPTVRLGANREALPGMSATPSLFTLGLFPVMVVVAASAVGTSGAVLIGALVTITVAGIRGNRG